MGKIGINPQTVFLKASNLVSFNSSDSFVRITVSTVASHATDLGSTPRQSIFLFAREATETTSLARTIFKNSATKARGYAREDKEGAPHRKMSSFAKALSISYPQERPKQDQDILTYPHIYNARVPS